MKLLHKDCATKRWTNARTARLVTVGLLSGSLVASGGAAFATGPGGGGGDGGETVSKGSPSAALDSDEGDDGSLYLESIGADPDQERESLGYDEQFGAEVFDSPLGEFVVDEDHANDALDPDPFLLDPVLIPGVGEVEYVVTDIDVGDLTDEALGEFEDAGVDVQELFEVNASSRRAASLIPDDDLVRAAGACEVDLGENVVARLEECVAAGEGAASNTDAVSEAPPTDFTTKAAAASPPAVCATATTVEYISRMQACVKNSKKITLINNRTGVSVGSFWVSGVTHISTSTSNTVQFTNSAYVKVSGRSGAAVGRAFTFSGKPACGFNCMSPAGNETFTGATNWRKVTGTVKGDVPSGQTRQVSSAWTFTITSPGVTLSSSFNALAVEPRCDYNTPQLSGRGCVFPSVWPVFKLSKSGPASGVAVHVSKAIAAGITSRLSRATSATKTANRAKACPGSLKKDPGYTCDEYPFASANKFSVAPDRALVPAGCRWPAVVPSGVFGYSRCQVLASHNSMGGSLLASFYRAQRIIVNDNYHVKITG